MRKSDGRGATRSGFCMHAGLGEHRRRSQSYTGWPSLHLSITPRTLLRGSAVSFLFGQSMSLLVYLRTTTRLGLIPPGVHASEEKAEGWPLREMRITMR